MITPQSGVYYKILRNGAPIPDVELLHLTSISAKESYIEGMTKTATLTFNISSTDGHNSASDIDANFDILYTYMFSLNDRYDIYLGKSENDSSLMVTGGVFDVAPSFAEDGLISFTATINSAMFFDPSLTQDENSATTYPEQTNLWSVLVDTCQARNIRLFASSSIIADLTSQTYDKGLTRPNAQTTTGFLQELAEEYGLYLDQRSDGIHVDRLDLTKAAKLYYKYRPVEEGYTGGLILSFHPELNKPGFYTATANGINDYTGEPIHHDADPSQNPKDQNEDSKKTFTRPVSKTGSGNSASSAPLDFFSQSVILPQQTPGNDINPLGL